MHSGLHAAHADGVAVSRLIIDLAPVRDSRHIDGSGRVVNDINYPVVANTNPPFLIAALEFFAARRPGADARCSRRGIMRATTFVGSPCSSFAALAASATR